jgi:tetratricopeptide (TPR) repeat protein
MFKKYSSLNYFFMMITVLLCNVPVSLGAKLTYERYMELGPSEQNRLIRQYVKQDDQGYQTASAYKYLVRTKLSARETLETALVMDRFYENVSDIFGGRFHDSIQTKLYLFSDEQSYTAFLSSKDITAGFSSGMYVPSERMLVVCGGENETSRRETLFHESTHQLLHAYTVKKSIPVWFNEGMATNLETWDVTKSRAENLRLAIVRSHLRTIAILAVMSGKAGDLEKLLSIQSEEWLSASDPAFNYAMAWSFVNFMLSTPERSAMLDRILESIRKGYNLEKILTPAMVRNLEKSWHEDQKTRLVLYDQFIVPAIKLADEKKTDQAIKLLERGTVAFPNLSDARFYRGQLCFDEKKFDEARKEFQAIEKRDPDYPDINLLLARTSLAMDDLPAARTYVQKTLRQDRKNAAARDLMREITQRQRIQQSQEPKSESSQEKM